MKIHLFILNLFLFIIIISCKKQKEEETPINETGKIIFKFNHNIDGQSLQNDTMKYINEAGNLYEIDEVKYFISDVSLYNHDGTKKIINGWTDIYYIDIDYPNTLTWNVYDDIPVGTYDSITFIFGISKEKNKSFMFVNPPESNMAWADVLGGGYHYMMINGKLKDTINQIENFNCHLGVGQLYKSNAIYNVDSIYAFVQNYFTVSLLNSSFTMNENQTKEIQIIMNIENWFKGKYVFDWNYYGGNIMENQEAMNKIALNGRNVFSVEYIH